MTESACEQQLPPPATVIVPITAPQGSGRVNLQRVGVGSVFLLLQQNSDEKSRFYIPCKTQTEAIRWMLETYKESLITQHGSPINDFVTTDVINFYKNHVDLMLLVYDSSVQLFRAIQREIIMDELQKTCEFQLSNGTGPEPPNRTSGINSHEKDTTYTDDNMVTDDSN